jgi:hypothetical protein
VAVPVNVPDHGSRQGSARASQTLIHRRHKKKTADASACAVFRTQIVIFLARPGIQAAGTRSGTDVAWVRAVRKRKSEPM